MSNLLSLSATQLNRAAALKDRIETLSQQLSELLGASVSDEAAAPATKRGRKKISAAGIARIKAAQKKRWAKVHAAKSAESAVKPVVQKRKMSAEGRAKIIAAVKARWARVKKAKKA
jgi:hypothetical protein